MALETYKCCKLYHVKLIIIFLHGYHIAKHKIKLFEHINFKLWTKITHERMKYDIIFLFTDKKKLNKIWLQKILCTLLLRTLVILSFVLYIYIYDVRFLTQMSLYLSLFLPLMQIQCQICELFLLHLCLFQLLLYKYLQWLKNLAA